MTRALVLGGGGPVGIAWQIGVLAGLADAGIDLAGADRIVGTSAGSVVGALLGSGRSPGLLYADHLDLAERTATKNRAENAPPDLTAIMQFMMRRPANGPSPPSLMAEMGAFALRAATVPEADYLDMMGRLFGLDQVWPERFVCTAADAETGEFRVWDGEAGVDVTRAVASSCAVPGLYPPVTIGGRRFIDGGVRSPTNSDLATGFDDVIVMAVTLNPFAEVMEAATRRELASVEATGARTTLIVPDSPALAAFGFNLMATTRREEIAQAGFAQGRKEAERLGAGTSKNVAVNAH